MARSIFSLFLITGIVGSVISLPPKVSWRHLLASTNETLLFGWRRPDNDPNITQYAVELYHHNGSLVGNNTLDIKTPERNNHMYIYVNLDPGETYSFLVQVCYATGCGDWSEPLEGTTSDGIPDPPRNVQMLCDHDFIEDRDTVTVTWVAPVNARGTIKSYNLTLHSRAQYRDENGLDVEKKESRIEIIDAKFDAMAYKITVLPNTEYTVQMCTINRSGCGPMTNISTNTQCKTLKNENKEFKLIPNTDEENSSPVALVDNEDQQVFKKSLSVCSIASGTGPCGDIIKRYYFNEVKCEEYIFGKCHGIRHSFKTAEECKQICETGISDKDTISGHQTEDKVNEEVTPAKKDE